ncbi:hypothetical protein F5Y18DRAFT_416501 [Xylariaceae sp. FL1019]|nr:hypothetical protein F5Y18DRAFT_416501 [Xylariaceae sp. FL1019]
MSARSSSSPRATSPSINKVDGDEGGLPHGQCRYILLNPEIKGHRCACVGFILNRSLPGVSCQCGHLSCYHVKTTESPPERGEVEDLRRRIQLLEGQLDRENPSGTGSILNQVVQRVSDLEEQFEMNKGEVNEEMQKCYSNVSRVWHSVTQLERNQSSWENRSGQYDERLDDHDDRIHRLDDRLIEIDEAAMAAEERVEVLEGKSMSSTSHRGRVPASGSESESISPYNRNALRTQRALGTKSAAPPRPVPVSFPWSVQGRTSSGVVTHQTRGSWTVHVSLLPTAAQPFPFEKDTNAYKRCLSRGLHQVIVVEGTDGESFTSAVTKAFGRLLQGREWVPLQARLCDAVTLEGLPMLRPLDASLIRGSYDLEFLRDHCAVCHPNGKIESLYIAMLQETFSWHFLRRSPMHMEGLEASWGYDALLDPDENLDDTSGEEDRLAAGDIMPLPSSLKRTASEMSRAASFSTSEGSEPPRPKLARTACLPVEVRRRGVETV